MRYTMFNINRSQSQPRHCMVVYASYPLGETRVQREAEALVKHGYKVDVICIRMPGEPATDEYRGVKIYREEYRLPYSLAKGSALGEKIFRYIRFFLSATVRLTWLHFHELFSSIQVHNLPDSSFSALWSPSCSARRLSWTCTT